MLLTTGTRLRSAVSTCEVLVVKAPTAGGDLRCADAEMTSKAVTPSDALASSGSALVLGKRYHHEPSGLELLCVKPGVGPLTFDGEELALKAAKPLPSSD